MSAPSRRLALSAQRLARRNKAAIAQLPQPLEIATVTAVQAGAASDGNALVTVSAHGTTDVVEGYAASYTPAVSDRVVVAVVDAQWIILCSIVGQP